MPDDMTCDHLSPCGQTMLRSVTGFTVMFIVGLMMLSIAWRLRD